MKRICRLACAAALAFTVAPGVQAQQNFEDVTIETTDLGNGLYMLAGRGGNIGVSAGEDGVFMIDDQYAPLTEKIRAAIAGITDKPVRYVINTHWHGDHTGGNENLGKAGAVIVAHENVRKRMSTDQVMEAFGRTVEASPEAALPVITFTENVTFHLNGREARVIHVAHAHTDGDSIVHFPEADVIHMGDLLFNGMYPFIDIGSGGDLDGMIAGQEMALELAGEKTKIIPGHGPLADRAALKRNHDLLVEVRKRVKKLAEAGKSEDEAVAADPLKDLNEEWGGGFINGERMVRFAYQSLED
ncbi:MAG: MBL fold metallo-hydrolase [Alphaproteobacteria bacterium]